MVDFVDLQYAQQLSGRLERFTIRHRNPYKINFRCPLCGDSQKSRSKARGWLLERDNSFYYYCHNCGESQSFSFFLKNLDKLIYDEYIAEKFVNKTKTPSTDWSTETENKFSIPRSHKDNPLKKIKKISQLRHDHPVNKYIKQRQIPTNQHYRIYYAPKFKSWINEIIPDKFTNVEKDEPRLVLPFLDENRKPFGVSARGFDPNGLRYLTIMFEEKPKIFGLDAVNFNSTYYVVEGAIDSFFLKNAIAMAGADGNTTGLKNLHNAVFVFDAEPRNKEIHKRMEKIINAGHSICIWPNNVLGKDINEMVVNGSNNVEMLIKDNTFSGLTAKLKFTEWRKA